MFKYFLAAVTSGTCPTPVRGAGFTLVAAQLALLLAGEIAVAGNTPDKSVGASDYVERSTTAPAEHEEFTFWPGKVAPGSETWAQKEVDYYSGPPPQMKMVRDVVSPTLTVYRPDGTNANGTAVVIAPGGAMRFLSWQNEGTDLAEWLAARGVDGIRSEVSTDKDTLGRS